MSDPAPPGEVPPHGDYVRAVEQLFLLVRRQGLMLSASDWRLAEGWAEAGVPLGVACRAILRGVEGFRAEHGPGRPLPSSLAYFAPVVADEAALASHKELAVAADDGAAARAESLETLVELLGEIEADGRAMEHAGVRAAYRELWRDAQGLKGRVERGELVSLVAELHGMQERLIAGAWSALDDAERQEIESTVERALTAERARLGVQGLEERRRALRDRALVERFGLLKVWEP